jgi:hypothetical protein
MKTNCPFCKSIKVKDSGLWDFFGCGTDVDKHGKSRQSMSCLRIQRDNLLVKVYELEDEINTLKMKINNK